MIVLSIIASISSVVLRNCINNMLCKKTLKASGEINSFNSLSYIVCILAFGILMMFEKLSWFTVRIALLFGVVTAISAMYSMMALSCGPMHITLLITTSSMIIPTVSGIFFGEKFSPLKLVAVFMLIGFIYLSLDKKSSLVASRKWFFCCLFAFLSQGAIGVIQKIHQSSVYKNETSGFLFITFVCSFLFGAFKGKKGFKIKAFSGKILFLAFVCGVCVFVMNYINLKLSGILPSQLFFPLINGSAIILSSLASVIIFKEKLTAKQLSGLVGGIISLILICLL